MENLKELKMKYGIDLWSKGFSMAYWESVGSRQADHRKRAINGGICYSHQYSNIAWSGLACTTDPA